MSINRIKSKMLNWFKLSVNKKTKEPLKKNINRSISQPTNTTSNNDNDLLSTSNMLSPLNPLNPISPFSIWNHIDNSTTEYTRDSSSHSSSRHYSNDDNSSSWSSNGSDSSSYDSGSSYDSSSSSSDY